MDTTFWTNTIWYIVLGILTIIELIFVMNKVKRKWFTLAFYFTILGLTLSFETVILIFLQAYEYYPFILTNPPLAYDDILAGNVFSQMSVSATGLIFSVLKLRFYWGFIFGFIYGVIEELFLHLEIYSHHWYRTWMTIILIPIFFYISRWIYNKLSTNIKPIYYYFCIFLGLFPLYIIFLVWGIFILTEIQTMSISYSDNPIWSRSIIILFQFSIYAWFLMYAILKDVKRYMQTVIILLLYLLYFVCYRLDIFIIKDGWFIVVSTVSIVWMYLSIYLMNRWYGGLKNLAPPTN